MNDLEKMVGCHRRLKGLGKSAPGDSEGTFDVSATHSPYMGPRTFVCGVTKGEGWESLSVSVAQRYVRTNRTKRRRPTPEELPRILALFFRPDELVVEIHGRYLTKESPAVYYVITDPELAQLKSL